MFGSVNKCNNVKDFRSLAKKKLPSPIFHYIDGAADDEITYKPVSYTHLTLPTKA